MDVGSPLFTLLQPKTRTDGVRTSFRYLQGFGHSEPPPIGCRVTLQDNVCCSQEIDIHKNPGANQSNGPQGIRVICNIKWMIPWGGLGLVKGLFYTMDHEVVPRPCKICDWLVNSFGGHFDLHQGKKMA